MSSSRFAGKVLEPICGTPSILFMVARARRAAMLDEVKVVTSVDASDEPLAALLEAHDVPFFRGSLDDVLSRYVAAAEESGAEIVVRLTGDCPLIDPAIIDGVVRLLVDSGADYASNIDPPSYADGLDVECFTRAALDRAHREARLPPEREHVTLWMRTEAAGLDRRNLAAIADSSRLRLTVDYPDDLEVVRGLVDMLGGREAEFDQYDMMRALDRKRDLLQRNRHLRNEALNQ